MLFIVATPIGHRGDFTLRAQEVLQRCDLILCEDTRHSAPLLHHYGIHVPLKSLHQFNERSQEETILQELKEGKNIALISDAGTPLISDPGLMLIQACIREKISFTAIPGACSVIQALLLSGFDATHFQFIGFLPREKGPKKEALLRALSYPGTTVCLETPQRIQATLELIHTLDAKRPLAIAREMTKQFEECLRGDASQLLAHFQEEKPLGEMVLLVPEGSLPECDLTLEQIVSLLRELHGLSLKEAIHAAARFKNLPKREVYRQMHLQS